MPSPDPSAHDRIRRGVSNFDNAVRDRVREDAVLAGNFAKFSQNPTMKHHLLSTGTKVWRKPALSTQWGASVSGWRTPRLVIPASGEGEKFSEKLFLRFATPFAPVRPGWQPKPRLSNSAPRPRPAELKRFPQRHLALGLRRALAQVLLRSFRPVFLTRRRTAAPKSWMSRLESTPPLRDQNMAPASSAVSLLSMTALLPRRLRFTVELTPSRPLVAWRSLTLVPHRLLSDTTYWIAFSRWGRHLLRASGIAPLVPGVVLANLPLCKLRRASA